MSFSVVAEVRPAPGGTEGGLEMGGRERRCALGSGGVVAARDKREGDGATPAGVWPIRRFLWRADRLAAPPSRVPGRPLRPGDGWCDAPGDPNYNLPVRLPYPASAESLWRDDEIYDLIVVLGYNDAPVEAGAGSAIFMHLARPDYAPTAGCIALALPDLAELLLRATAGDAVRVTLPPPQRGSSPYALA